MLDAPGLIAKHRGKGVLVDTNLLVLYLVGRVNIERIATFKRTSSFDKDDFRLLVRLIEHFGPPLVSTPHVLSQISDLTDLPGNELTKIRKLFRILIGDIEEKFDTARTIADSPVFERLGLCDAAIQTACAKNMLVLTSDLQLHLALETRGANALNFNHVRQLQWAAN